MNENGTTAITAIKWTRVRPGRYTGTDGTNTITVQRVREGMLHCNDWMWVLRINGEHIANEDTLATAKLYATAFLNS